MVETVDPARGPVGRSDETTAGAWAVGEVVRLRKAHPCGSDTWTVVRLGADIGLRCTGCARKVMVPRSQLARQVRPARVARSPGTP